MNLELLNNKIVIIDNKMKNSLLELLSGKLINTKIITLNELKRNYYFDYDNEAVYYLVKNYNLIPSIAKKYIDNMYYIKDIDNDKTKYLIKLKKELEDNKLLIKNELFKSFIKNKDIVLFDKYIDKFYLNILSDCNIEYIDLYSNSSVKSIYECNNMEDEISFVFNSISKLIKSGININNIKLSNVHSDYYYVIKKYSDMFNIKVDLDSDSSINGTHLVKIFKDNYDSDISSTLNKVYECVNSDYDMYIYKDLINIVNNYSFISDYNDVKDLIYEDIKNIKTKTNHYDNSIKIIDFKNDIVSDNDYVFLINYNEGVIPVNHKDEDYFSDKVKSLLGISTSVELNTSELLNIKDRIKGINHLIITYSLNDINGKLYISSSYDEELLRKENIINDYNNSNSYNKYKLIEYKDLYNKYGSISEDFKLLNSKYPLEYKSYDNKFSGIKSKVFNNGYTLSYSSLEKYNECAFKYYLDYILKLDKYEDNFSAILGSVTHKVLSICLNGNKDFDSVFNESINEVEYEFKDSEMFFVNKLKDTLQKSIGIIKNQLNYTQLSNIMCEKEIIIEVNKNLNIKFKGFVDKIMYENVNGFNVVVIIDYKTGNDEININNSIYGLNMQLPIYLYLIKNSGLLSNVKIGGIYLQKIYSNKNDDDLEDSLKLLGYTNSDESITSIVDSSYENSKLIKSMKLNKDGSFYYHAKIFNDDNIEYLNNLVNDKIRECYENINNNIFDINPKVIGINNLGCRYCKYKDICYVKEEDKVVLNTPNSILGGEEDA